MSERVLLILTRPSLGVLCWKGTTNKGKRERERERAREWYKSKADYCVWETVEEEGTFSRRICRHIVHDWVDASQRASSAYHSRNDGETRRRLSRDPQGGRSMQGATGLIVSHLEFKTAAAAVAVFLILLRWRLLLPSAVKLIFTRGVFFCSLYFYFLKRGRRRRQEEIMTLGQLKISDRVKFVVAPSVGRR